MKTILLPLALFLIFIACGENEPKPDEYIKVFVQCEACEGFTYTDSAGLVEGSFRAVEPKLRAWGLNQKKILFDLKYIKLTGSKTIVLIEEINGDTTQVLTETDSIYYEYAY